MNNLLKSIDHQKLFIIDAIGALCTAIVHGFILTRFKSSIAIPSAILIGISIAAFCFTIYSTSCALLKPKNWRPLLRLIAYANTMIALVLIVTLYCYSSGTSTLAVLYLIGEILVILGIVYLELKTANQ